MVDRKTADRGCEHNPSHDKVASMGKLASENGKLAKTVLDHPTQKTQLLPTNLDPTVVDNALQNTKKCERTKNERLNIVGKVIDNKFKVIREISCGGMGVVYEAEHLQLKKRFAIKSILPEFTQNPNFHKRFDQEAKTQALLQHANIVQVTDFIKENGQFYMVMEYIKGQGLNDLIRENKINEEDMLSYIKDVLKGLDHAHRKGIIHRDIKSSNIMITQDKTAKIMDFGIALLADTDDGKPAHRGVMGTPPYMSPEQITRPKAMDHRSDIYSTGIVMFEMLCGKRPFDGKTVGETKKNHIHQKLPEIKPVFPDCASEIIHILKKSLEKIPAHRFRDTNEFLDSIEVYERQTKLECRSCKSPNRVKNKYKLRGEKCTNCGKTLSMKSKFTRIWASAFALALVVILTYLLYPWPGTLVVRTKPGNAHVFINGEQKGLSPFEASLSPGTYEIVVKKETMAVTRSVVIKKNGKAALEFDIYEKIELHKIAFDAIKKAFQSASYICRDLNDLMLSQKNLEIAKSIGDSALTESYQQQIMELEQNIDDGFSKYADSFNELKAIKPDIRNAAYSDYNASLNSKGGDIENLAVVWRHFEQYPSTGMQKIKWKTDIIKFANKNSL